MASERDYSSLPLGKSVAYPRHYDPTQLQGIARADSRRGLALDEIPLYGADIWNAYELSWLDRRGKPQVACAQFCFSAQTPLMVESKSLKLYLNSFNHSRFDSNEAVAETIRSDLGGCAGADVEVALLLPDDWPRQVSIAEPKGLCLDTLAIDVEDFSPSAALLQLDGDSREERVYTNLFRSRCPVTGQPDWATVDIAYRGPGLVHADLLRYLVSFRDNSEFHEQCVERIYGDLYRLAQPDYLSVCARYTRRGGLDINPYRSSRDEPISYQRLPRQ